MAGNHFSAHSLFYCSCVFSKNNVTPLFSRYKNSDNYRVGKIFIKLFANYFAGKQKESIFASLFQKAASWSEQEH